MCSTLLVDDDEVLRVQMRKLFERNGHELHEVNNVAHAWRDFENGSFEMVLANYRKADFNSLTLVKWVKASGVQTPIVLMADASEPLDRPQALELGASEYLVKPLQPKLILSSVEALLADMPELASGWTRPSLDGNFLEINVEILLKSDVTHCDLYVRLSESKYVQLARKGQRIDPERIQAYSEKGVLALFVRKGQAQNAAEWVAEAAVPAA